MLFRSNDTATTEIYTRFYTLSLHDALPICAHILPAQTDQTGHGIMVADGGLQDLCQSFQGHLNFATISMMPGIVCNCAACVG